MTLARRGPDPRIVELLREWGYRVAFRQDGWVECLIWRALERFEGQGGSEDEALDDALFKLLPSHAARRALRLAVNARGRSIAHVAHQSTTDSSDSDAEDDDRDDVLDEDDGPAFGTGVVEDPSAEEEQDGDEGEAYELPRPQVERPRALSADEARADLDGMSVEIDAAKLEVSLWSAPRQRMMILYWIAAARSIEEACPGEEPVQWGVRNVAQKLGTLAKRWWPGDVSAMRQATLPTDCAREVHWKHDKPLVFWEQVAEAAIERLGAMQEQDVAHGLGPLGWADDDALAPFPPDADEELKRLTARVVEFTGPLDEIPERRVQVGPDDVGRLRELAERLRWLRGAVQDTWTWGGTLGRLRWLVARLPQSSRRSLEEVLLPGHRPAATWADRFDGDPSKSDRKRLKKDVLRSRPRPDTAPADADLAAWFTRAAPCDGLTPERIAGLLSPFAERLPGLEVEQGEVAAVLDQVLAALRENRADVPEPEWLQAIDDEEPEPSAAHAPGATERQLRRVLPLTSGRRALVLTDHALPDPSALVEALQLSGLEVVRVDPKRPRASTERLAEEPHDLLVSIVRHHPQRIARAAHGVTGNSPLRIWLPDLAGWVRALARTSQHATVA